MIRVVTVGREYACGGSAIAAKLATRLGWKLWDEQLSHEIAQRADCDLAAVRAREERRDPLYYRLLKSFLRGSFEASLQTNRLRLLDADRIAAITEQLVREAAAEGQCVIVGRGAQYFLQDREDTYHVFVYAPYEYKLRREQEAGRSAAHAAQLLAATDRDRAAFIRAYFGKPWPTRVRYDLMVNSKAGDEAAVETILAAIDVRQRMQAR
jgi:cytidylate kinase